MLSNDSIALIVIFSSAFLISGWATRRKMAPYYSRSCMGKRWKSRFPRADKAAIRHFLELFVSSFALNRKQKLKFEPDDRILDVYRALYPPSDQWAGDQMECESFAMALKSEYGVDVLPTWKETITLGEVFALTQKS